MGTDWSRFGIHNIEESFPGIAGTFSGRCLLVAGGRCVWEDLKETGYLSEPSGFHVMCINDVYMHFPGPVNHFYSNDARFSPRWLSARRELLVREFEGQAKLHTHSNMSGLQYKWPWPGHGTSSLSGAYTLLALGYDEIILCGVPLDDSGHYFDPPWKKTNFSREVIEQEGGPRYWKNMLPLFDGKLKVMSGRLKELF